MTKASDNIFPKLIGAEGAAPATPAAASSILYVKADGLWYSKDDAGVETLVSGGAAGMTNPMTTQGDIISGGASGAPGRLAIGTAGQVLTVNAGATAPEWAAASGGGGSPFALDETTLDGSLGDDFDSTSLDAKWTRQGIGADTELFENSRLRVDVRSATAAQHYRETIVSADEIDVVCDLAIYGSENDMIFGPFLADSSGTGIAMGFRQATNVLDLNTLTSWAAALSPTTLVVGAGVQQAARYGAKIWYHLAKRGGFYFMRYSLDGNTWSRWSAHYANALAPVRAGFGRYSGTTATAAAGFAIDRFDVKRYSRSANRVITPSSGTTTYTASSAFDANYVAANAANGNYADSAGNAWAKASADSAPYWNVAWSVAQDINRVMLFPRDGDGSGHGYLLFSDGSKVPIPKFLGAADGVPISFASKSTTSLRVVLTGDFALNCGFTEVEAYLATPA